MPFLPPAERPRVCLTWGASFGGTQGNLTPVRLALEGLLACDVEVVIAVASGQRPLLGDLPGGVRVLESVPLHTVLPGCALVVHQGGAGTTLTALAREKQVGADLLEKAIRDLGINPEKPNPAIS